MRVGTAEICAAHVERQSEGRSLGREPEIQAVRSRGARLPSAVGGRRPRVADEQVHVAEVEGLRPEPRPGRHAALGFELQRSEVELDLAGHRQRRLVAEHLQLERRVDQQTRERAWSTGGLFSREVARGRELDLRGLHVDPAARWMSAASPFRLTSSRPAVRESSPSTVFSLSSGPLPIGSPSGPGSNDANTLQLLASL